MAEYQKTIITNAGISVLNRVLSGKATATFTRAVSSTDDLSSKTESELRAMTGFSSVMQNGVCSRYDIHSSNMVSLDLLFTNEGLGNSYMINAVGLYAKASDSSTEVLYAIARAGKDAKGNSLAEQMPAYAGNLTKFTISLYTQVGQASSVSVSITDEGVVKSINGGDVTPDVNGDVVVDDSSHAKFIEAELIHGHLLVPLVDCSGNPVTDPAGNQLVADEYLPKSVKLGDHPAIFPGSDNTVRLPVYTQAEINALLSAKADMTSVTTKEDVDAQTGLIYGILAQNRLVTPLAGDDGKTLLDEHGNALLNTSGRISTVKLGDQTYTPDSTGVLALDAYSKKEINNLVDSLKLAIDQVKALIK